MPCCRRRRQSRAGQHGVRMASMYYNTKRIETNRRSFVHTAGNSCVSKLRVGCDVRGSLVCWSSWPAGNGCCRATSQMLAGTTIWGPSLTKHRRRRTRRNSTDCMSVLPTVTYIKSKLATYCTAIAISFRRSKWFSWEFSNSCRKLCSRKGWLK